ncbi:hypothetical protein SPI_02727 [Niveomyces insectorum RCEF 264]|uniref:DNAJ-containing protein X-domain domain-containing protein n=1 Tax=Niveomyces insectorum RCEF 264 TaxID=1081102 RepID=A0A162MRU4_9HYPO|nr:hypothetical protein SPI_02727 [Niveomyces insectorum RCEF 264]
MDEALKESLKTAEAEGVAGANGYASAHPPPAMVVEEEEQEHKSPNAPPSTTRPTPGAAPAAPSGDAATAAADAENAKDLKKKDGKKKASLSKEQREQLAAYERERARVRQERVDALVRKLLDRIAVWTETDRGDDVTRAFQAQIQLEVEDLKMESFGLDILHAIGQTYAAKATALLRSQKFLGVPGFFSRLRDKGTLVKDTWHTISSAIEAQQTLEEMAQMEERGGDAWTDEKRAEYERRVTGKILTAAWRGSKFEIQSVLRDVCDAVLEDKTVPQKKRLQRAEALLLIADVCLKAQRTPEEEGDYMAFEQLVAEAAMKKDKESKKKHKNKGGEDAKDGKDGKDGKETRRSGWARGSKPGGEPSSADAGGAAEAPNVPRA